MYSNMFLIRRATLIAFIMLGLTSLGLMISCSKETGINPENVSVEQTQNEIKNFKSDEYLTFDKVKQMLEGKGTLKKAPNGYNSVYPPSERYDIWLFTETLTGKIHEIYVYKDLETMKQIANQVCYKKLTNEGGVICCDGDGSECYTVFDECGNVCIILCLA